MTTCAWALLTICGLSQPVDLELGRSEVDEQGEAIAALNKIQVELAFDAKRGEYYLIAPNLLYPKQKQSNRVPLERLATIDKVVAVGLGLKDSHLEQLSYMKNLRRLDIFDGIASDVTDTGIKHLQRLVNLREFHLDYGSHVTDDSLKYLGKLFNLEVLSLSYAKVGDSGLKHLKHLSNLRTLDLEAVHVSDEGLKHLIHLTRLETVDFSYNDQLTDKCLKHLRQMRSLRTAILYRTGVSDEGITTFQQHRPNVSISNH